VEGRRRESEDRKAVSVADSSKITGISSMATREVLAELAAPFERRSGRVVAFESVGGVDAAKRVISGEPFDVVVLASDAIDKLLGAGRIVAGSKVGLARSGVAIAVRSGAPRPEIGSEEAVRRAVLSSRSVGYSTGPSGAALARLFERWGIAGEIKDRIVLAPSGVPVGTLVARGEVDIGFQQLSELMHLSGVDVIGPLPPAIQIITTFSAGLSTDSTQGDAVRSLLDFLTSPLSAEAKRRHGMEPA
jgi:molybdate transport system substrate-binding protein